MYDTHEKNASYLVPRTAVRIGREEAVVAVNKQGSQTKPKKAGLKVKIMMFALVISIIPVSILGLSAYQIFSSNLLEQKKQHIKTNLQSINQALNSTINARKIPALRFANSTDAYKLVNPIMLNDAEERNSLDALDRFLGEYLNTKGIRSVVLCGKNGFFVVSNNLPEEKSSHCVHLQEQESAAPLEPWWSDIAYDQGYYLPYHIPIVNVGDKSMSGVITVNFLEKELQATYSYFDSEDDQLFLVTDEGRIISATDASVIKKPIHEIIGQAYDLANQPDGLYFYTWMQGDKKLVSSIRNEGNNMHIVSISSLQTIFKARRQFTGLLMLAVSASLGITMFLSVFLSKNITEPVKQLVQTIKGMRADSLANPVPRVSQDEFAIISQALAELMDKLHHSQLLILSEQKAKREAELRILLMQINPHFLYNTLSSAIWLIQMEQKDQAIQLITALSALFKLGLGKGQEEITIADELAYLDNYLAIHKVRYGDGFDYEISCPDALGQSKIIRLLIQPLVENAIYHGINSHLNERGHIVITVSDRQHFVGQFAKLHLLHAFVATVV